MSQLLIFSVEQAKKTAEGQMPGINLKDIELLRIHAELTVEACGKMPEDYLHVNTITALADTVAATTWYGMPKAKAGIVGRSRCFVARR